MIYLFNKLEQLVRILDEKLLIGWHHVLAINQFEQANFEVPAGVDLSEVFYFGFFHGQVFKMFAITEKRLEDTLFVEGLDKAERDLNSVSIIKDKRPQNVTADQALVVALEGTGYELGQVTGLAQVASLSFYYISPREALVKIIETFGCEFRVRYVFEQNRIVRRYIDLANRFGQVSGKQFVYGDNALEVAYEESADEVVTALIGRGKGELTENGGYGRRLEFSDVVWSRSAGKPVDKPKGQNYLVLDHARQAYGLSQNGQLKHRWAVWVDEQIEDPEILIEKTWEQLQRLSIPLTSFKAKVVDLKGEASYGDSVAIIRDKVGLAFEARIHKMVVDKLNNDRSSVELGDYETLKSRQLAKNPVAQLAMEQSQYADRLEAFNRMVEVKIIEKNAEIDEAMRLARLDFDNAKELAEQKAEALRAEISSEVEAVARESQAVKQAVEAGLAEADRKAKDFESDVRSRFGQIETKANQVAAEASQAGQKADQALTRAGASENLARTAKDTADRAIQQAGDNLRTAQERASQLQTDLDAAKRTITSQAKDILNQAKAQSDLTRKVQTVETTANGTKTTVTELTKTVNANTGNLTSVTQRVATAENTLTNVRNQYSQLSQTVDGQTGKVSSLERQTADLSSGLDGVKERFENLSVGAKNFIPDFGFEKNQQFALHQSDWTFERIEDATARSGSLIKATCRRAGGGGFHRVLFDLRGSEWQGKTMTYAVDVKASRAVSMRIGAEAFEGWGKVHDVTTTWKRVAQTGTVAFNQWHSFMWYINEGAWRVGDVVYLRDPQLEEGNIATTPMAAEEDFRQEFATYIRNANENSAALARQIETAEGKADSAKSQAQQTADSLKLKADQTTVDNVTGRLRTAEGSITLMANEIAQRLTSTQVEQAITGKGYQTANQVETAISGKGYQTAGQVNTAIEGKGYQTKGDVDANITGRGYITSSALDSYVPTTTFNNYKKETSGSIERELTATRALIPTEFSGNILKDGKQSWRNARGATYTLDEEIEAGRDYTLTVKYWTGSGGQAMSTNLFGSWQVGIYDSLVDAWVIRGRSSTRLNKGHQFSISAHPGTGLGNADWATLTKGPLAMSKYQEPFSSFVTSVDFQKVQETAQLYERVIGKTEGDITANLARQVMTSELYQTEVTKARDNQANLLVGTEQTKELIFDRPNTSNFQVHALFSLPGNRSFAQHGFKVGDSVTLSFDYEVTDNNFRRVVFNNFRVEGYDSGYKFSVGAVTSARSGAYQATFTFETEAQLSAYRFSMRADAPSLNCKLVIKNCRLNRGTVAYPWQVHFEDLSAQATRVTQLADSYAIKTLGSAGQVLSELNLNTGGVRIAGKLIHLDGSVTANEAFFHAILTDRIEAGHLKAGAVTTDKLDANAVTAAQLSVDRALIDKLVANQLWAERLFAQEGFVQKLKATEFSAGQITSGTLSSRLIDADSITADKLKVDQAFFTKLMADEAYLKQLFAKQAFITQVQSVEVTADKIRGGNLQALNGAMTINLNRANITFNQNATFDFNSSNNALVRRRGTHTAFLHFVDEPKGGVYAGLGVTSSGDGINSSSSGRFAGVRIFRTAVGGTHSTRHETAADQIELYGDNILLQHAFDGSGNYLFQPTKLDKQIDMNTVINMVLSVAHCIKLMRGTFDNMGNPGLKTDIDREINGFLSAIDTYPQNRIHRG